MSARRLTGLLLACAALAAAGLAARAAAPRGGSGAAASSPGAVVLTLAAADDTTGGGSQARDPGVPMKLAYATTLPDSAGRGIAERWCLLCHSAMLITQQAKDSTGWEKTLAQMEKWGVAVTPEERDTLRAYLIGLFGPRGTPPR